MDFINTSCRFMDESSSSESDLEVLDYICNISIPRSLNKRKNPFEIYTDEEFKSRYCFNKDTVIFLSKLIRPALAPVMHRKYTLSVFEQIFIALRFFGAATFQEAVGDEINVHKTTVSRVVYKVSREIAKLAERYICMPNMEDIGEVKAQFNEIARFPNVIGCVDGTHIPIQSPGGENAELFKNSEGFFSVNVQVMCDAKLQIRNIDAHWHGSAHDSIVYHNSHLRECLNNNELDGYLLGDSAYPCEKYLMTPFSNPNTNAEKIYNEAHIKTRNIVNKTIRLWKKRFACLSQKIRLKLDHTLAVITATAVLHNIALLQNDNKVDIDSAPDTDGTAEYDSTFNEPIFSEGIYFRQLLLEQHFRCA